MPFGNSATKTAIAERRRRAVELRIAGHTLEEIAEKLGLQGGRARAHAEIEAALKAASQQLDSAVGDLRELENQRLDELWKTAFGLLSDSTVTVSHGKVIYLEDPETGEKVALKDNAPVLAAIDRCVRISERRSKLNGLDAPQRVETTGTVRYEIVGLRPEDLAAEPAPREYVPLDAVEIEGPAEDEE